MNFPYLNEIKIDRGRETPLYLQISQGIASLIKQGILKAGQKLPGSRTLADILGVNRNTVCLATDELLLEGWVVARTRSGLYVNAKLPLIENPLRLKSKAATLNNETTPCLRLTPNENLEVPEIHSLELEFNDGIPDPRLSPLNELGREYHKLLKKSGPLKLFSYSDAQGEPFLRKVLADSLNEHRGLQITSDHLLISRGSIMALSLIAQTTLKKGDAVVVGELSYRTANLIFEHAGALLLRIPVDKHGVDTFAIEALLQKESIRFIYVTSHHHHPTTVTLAPERRIHLYELAKKHHFFILEDDYDFDYHYENKPTLPIASMDSYGLVVYIGSWSKTMYPGIRTGFMVAPPHLIMEMIRYRRIFDRQGDHVMERALANLIYDGTMQRYLRKSKKIYKSRKNYFCQLLKQRLDAFLDFVEPEGGMAVWVTFKEGISLPHLAQHCEKQNLYLSDGRTYNPPDKNINSCRMGFAHMNEEELEQACMRLLAALQELSSS